MAFFLFVAGNLFAALCARKAATLLLGERHGWRALVLSLGLFPVGIALVLLLLGGLGQLNMWACVVVLGGGAALLALARGPKSDHDMGSSALEPGPPAEGLWYTSNVGLLAGLGGLLAAKALLGASDFNYDDFMYHAVAPAYWIAEGGFMFPPFNWETSYYPMNCELVSLWLMLPFRGDGLVSLTSLLWLLICTAAICCLVEAMGCSRGTALFAAVVFLTATPVRDSLDTVSGTDVGGTALVLAAAAIVLRSPSHRNQSYSGREALAAGLLAGFAVGSRVSFAPAALVLLVWLLGTGRKVATAGARYQRSVFFLLGAVATGSYWYVRNVLLTGNPVFPAEFGPFTGPFSTATQLETSLVWKLLAEPTRLQHWRQFIDMQAAWPTACLALAVVGYVGAAVKTVIGLRRHSGAESQQRLLLVIGLVSAALGAVAPFSGSVNDPEAAFIFYPRYFLLSFTVGLVLFTSLLDGRVRGRVLLWRAFGVLVLVLSWGKMDVMRSLLVLTVGTVGVWGSSGSYAARALRQRLRAHPWPALLVLFVGVAAIAPAKQRATDEKLFRYVWDTAPIGKMWEFLEHIEEGGRIAWFAAPADFYYPLFGRGFQHHVVIVTSTGERDEAMHQRWASEGLEWWSEWSERWHEWYGTPGLALGNELVANLQKERVSHVVVTKWPRATWPPAGTELARQWGRSEWPPQHDVLSGSAGVDMLYDDGTSKVFGVARPGFSSR